MGDGPAVISGRICNDSAPTRFLVQCQYGIRGTADLEGASVLHRFELQENTGAGAPGTGQPTAGSGVRRAIPEIRFRATSTSAGLIVSVAVMTASMTSS